MVLSLFLKEHRSLLKCQMLLSLERVIQGFLRLQSCSSLSSALLMKIYRPVVYAWENSINGFAAETFRDGETKRIGNLSVTAIHVPGHSTDSLVYRIDSVLFTGDTIYSGSIAMTHSFVERALLIRSIEEKIMVLEENTLLNQLVVGEKETIAEYIHKADKEATVVAYKRFALGE